MYTLKECAKALLDVQITTIADLYSDATDGVWMWMSKGPFEMDGDDKDQ